ncbi:putative small nuclear ribonucleoprotein G [Drosera capensis]
MTTLPSPSPELISRQASTTELSWIKAVPTGTGTTVLALLLTHPPHLPLLSSSLHRILSSHPLLRSTLSLSPFPTFLIPPPPSSPPNPPSLLMGPSNSSPISTVLESELNENPWERSENDNNGEDDDGEVFEAKVYEVEGMGKWVVVLKVHTAVCDRTAAAGVLRELMGYMRGRDYGKGSLRIEGESEDNLGIEELVPRGKGNKPFWARGKDMIGYSLNSLRLSNLRFVDVEGTRRTEMVRLRFDREETARLVEACRSRDIKLCGAYSAAALIASRALKGIPEGEWEKYAVTTLVDCRTILEPALSSHHVGFYHSAILNTHDLNGGEDLWDLARRTYKLYQDSKNRNKHFTDMADLNFLMCKAIDNPGLTPSSSLRTSFISVFEDPIIDDTEDHVFEELGVEDYVGCATVHGVGPSIAIFDTVRNGKLDCACVYPAPLHSREQMQELIDVHELDAFYNVTPFKSSDKPVFVFFFYNELRCSALPRMPARVSFSVEPHSSSPCVLFALLYRLRSLPHKLVAMSRSGQPPDLKKYMDKRLQIKLNANRMVTGVLRGFDQFMNLVIDNTVEENGNEKNEIGTVVIRGNSVVTVEALEPVQRMQG